MADISPKATIFPEWMTGTDVQIQIKDSGVTYEIDNTTLTTTGNETIDTFHMFKNKTNATNVVTRLDEEISFTSKADKNNPFFFYLLKKQRKIKNDRQVEVVYKNTGYGFTYTEIMTLATVEPSYTADAVTEFNVTLKMLGDPSGNIQRLNFDGETLEGTMSWDEIDEYVNEYVQKRSQYESLKSARKFDEAQSLKNEFEGKYKQTSTKTETKSETSESELI